MKSAAPSRVKTFDARAYSRIKFGEIPATTYFFFHNSIEVKWPFQIPTYLEVKHFYHKQENIQNLRVFSNESGFFGRKRLF